MPADASAVEGLPRSLSFWVLMIVLTLVKVRSCVCVFVRTCPQGPEDARVTGGGGGVISCPTWMLGTA